MYYAFIENEKINGCGQCPIVNEEFQNIEITEEIYNNIDRYIWSGAEIILNPNYEQECEQKEKERISRLSLTKREVLLAIFDDKGITPEQIKEKLDERGKIEFDYANEYFRGNPLIDALGNALGYTSQQLDYLFTNKTMR